MIGTLIPACQRELFSAKTSAAPAAGRRRSAGASKESSRFPRAPSRPCAAHGGTGPRPDRCRRGSRAGCGCCRTPGRPARSSFSFMTGTPTLLSAAVPGGSSTPQARSKTCTTRPLQSKPVSGERPPRRYFTPDGLQRLDQRSIAVAGRTVMPRTRGRGRGGGQSDQANEQGWSHNRRRRAAGWRVDTTGMNLRYLVRLGLAALLGAAFNAAFAQQALEIIPLRHRTVDQVLPALQPLLEPGATLSGSRGQLFLRASASNADDIKRALAAIDRPAKRLQISVRLDDALERERRDIQASGSVGSARRAHQRQRAGLAQRTAASASTSACRSWRAQQATIFAGRSNDDQDLRQRLRGRAAACGQRRDARDRAAARDGCRSPGRVHHDQRPARRVGRARRHRASQRRATTAASRSASAGAPASRGASGSRWRRSTERRAATRVCRRRSARRGDRRLQAAAAAARDGAGDSRCDRAHRGAGRRGGHRHRQDLRLPGSRAARRRQGHRLDRHQDAAGPALRSRPARGAQGAGGGRERRAAQGALQLCLPVPLAAQRRGRRGLARGGEPAAAHRALRRRLRDRRSRRSRRRAGGRADLGARHLDARQLPRPGLPGLRRLLRDAGAPQRARRRRGGDQPPPLLRRRGAARRRHFRAAAGVQHGDLRRGAPAAGDGAPVLRRDRLEHPAGRARARCARGAARRRRRVARARGARQSHGESGARSAAGAGRDREPAVLEPGAAPARLRRQPRSPAALPAAVPASRSRRRPSVPKAWRRAHGARRRRGPRSRECGKPRPPTKCAGWRCSRTAPACM